GRWRCLWSSDHHHVIVRRHCNGSPTGGVPHWGFGLVWLGLALRTAYARLPRPPTQKPDEEAMVAEAENKALFRRFYEDAWNLDDLAMVEELLAPDFINHELPAEVTAPHRELYKQAIDENRRFFPDWTLVIEDMIAEEERVVARWTGRGTHAAEGPKSA